MGDSSSSEAPEDHSSPQKLPEGSTQDSPASNSESQPEKAGSFRKGPYPWDICKSIAELRFGKSHAKLVEKTSKIYDVLRDSWFKTPGITQRVYCQNVLDSLKSQKSENEKVQKLLDRMKSDQIIR